jgi:hypothetical protein
VRSSSLSILYGVCARPSLLHVRSPWLSIMWRAWPSTTCVPVDADLSCLSILQRACATITRSPPRQRSGEAIRNTGDIYGGDRVLRHGGGAPTNAEARVQLASSARALPDTAEHDVWDSDQSSRDANHHAPAPFAAAWFFCFIFKIGFLRAVTSSSASTN